MCIGDSLNDLTVIVGLLWHVLWLLTYILQERDHLIPLRSPRLYTPDGDVVPHFQLRETLVDEEVRLWWARARWGPPLLLFQLIESPDGQLGPKYSLCASTWGFLIILFTVGPWETMWCLDESFMMGRGAVMLIFYCKRVLKVKNHVKNHVLGPNWLKRPSA